MSTHITLADAKARLSEVVGRVNGQHERFTVTVHGRPSAVVLAVEDLSALEETLEILAEEETMRRLRQSEKDVTRGDIETQDELARAMERRRAGR